jgi:hypothetical protein
LFISDQRFLQDVYRFCVVKQAFWVYNLLSPVSLFFDLLSSLSLLRKAKISMLTKAVRI